VNVRTEKYLAELEHTVIQSQAERTWKIDISRATMAHMPATTFAAVVSKKYVISVARRGQNSRQGREDYVIDKNEIGGSVDRRRTPLSRKMMCSLNVYD